MFMLYREGMDDKEAQANTLQGAVMLLLALGFDGLTGHLEDAVIKEMEWKHGQVGNKRQPSPTSRPGSSGQSPRCDDHDAPFRIQRVEIVILY